MNKLEIKYISQNEIIPYVNNTRLHSKEQIEKLKSSIKEFGMVTPIGIHNGTIVYGHARFEALKELGWEEFPTVDLSYMSESQRKAYTIADNRLSLDASWDEEMLKIELSELEELGFDMDLTGFEKFEIDELFGDDNSEIEQDYSDKNKEIDVDSYEGLMDLKFKLTFDEYNLAKEKLQEIANVPENALKILLKMEL
jgi:hypothetical protein